MNILFLSAIDFKEKSIQVIRKTPEAYAEAGWNVDYIVGRDNCVWGNYYYEEEFNPENVNVIRVLYPFTGLRNLLKRKRLRTVINKVSLLFLIFKIRGKASALLKKNSYDLVYGYEIHGVLALGLLRLSGSLKGIKTIHRFQGSWLPSYIQEKKYLKLAANLDAVVASKLKADAVIMTDDGTQGDLLYKRRKILNFYFWVNGVDKYIPDESGIRELKKNYNINQKNIFLSVSRLEGWKRVERCIETIRILVDKYNFTDFRYLLVGGGSMDRYLKELVRIYHLENYIIFTGPIANNKIHNYYGAADIFFSMYDLSNVGNPLLEAIRSYKIIFTLANGDTPRWIEHKVNGYIYPVDDNLFKNAANDLFKLMNNPAEQKRIIGNIKALESERLWTWGERFNAETELAEKLLLE